MVRAIVLIGFAIPGIIASIFAAALILQPDIPFSAATPRDMIDIEYTKYQILTAQGTERTTSQKTQVLEIQNDGSVSYDVIENGISEPTITDRLDDSKLHRLKAIVKETGLIAIPAESFPVTDGVEEYQKSSIRVTLNGEMAEIRWPDQNATEKFIPPIIAMIESELDSVISDVKEQAK